MFSFELFVNNRFSRVITVEASNEIEAEKLAFRRAIACYGASYVSLKKAK